MAAYYNEYDAAAAAILRQQIADGVIAPGIVDTRSIKEVQFDDIRGFDQYHWFAGGGLWSVAARRAGWIDSRPIWSASCPCQPFSAAGKGGGTDDPRHLWPDLLRIIRAARAAGNGPSVLVGEQVSGAAGYGWFDGVRADLAAEDYASRSRDFPACAVDAPHQRNRLYWCAVDNAGSVREREPADAVRAGRNAIDAANAGNDRMADTIGGECDGRPIVTERRPQGRPKQDRPIAPANDAGAASGVADSAGQRRVSPALAGVRGEAQSERPRHGELERLSGRNGTYWSDAEWIVCHDGKARRAKPGLRLLVDGLPGRVDLWRVGGNAIVPEAAVEVIAALREVLDAERVRLTGVFA